MRLAFFGASVTAQKEGYWYHFSKLMKTHPIQMGYGSQHLSDAGICKLQEVLDMKPTVCVIDWLSSGYKEISEKTKTCLDTIIHGFSSINCKLFFIILPKEEHKERLDFYKFVKEHLKKKNIPVIDLTEYIEFSPRVCRDSVHTTSYGARMYAKIMYRKYKKFEDSLEVVKDTKPTEYSSVKKLEIKKRVKHYLTLSGNAKIVTFSLILNKENGFIKIGEKKIQTWDRWCHYERPNCKINDIEVDGETRLEILEDDFDYSACTDKSINFNKIKKSLHIEDIFYVGEKLEILDGE